MSNAEKVPLVPGQLMRESLVTFQKLKDAGIQLGLF